MREWICYEVSYDLTTLYYIEGLKFYAAMEFHFFFFFYFLSLEYKKLLHRFFVIEYLWKWNSSMPEFRIRVGDTWPQRFQGMHCFRGGKFVLVKFALSDARRCVTSWLKIIIYPVKRFRRDAGTKIFWQDSFCFFFPPFVDRLIYRDIALSINFIIKF